MVLTWLVTTLAITQRQLLSTVLMRSGQVMQGAFGAAFGQAFGRAFGRAFGPSYLLPVPVLPTGVIPSVS